MRKDHRLDVLCIVARRGKIGRRLPGAAGERIRPVAGVDNEQILAVLHRERIEGRCDLVTRQAVGGERILLRTPSEIEVTSMSPTLKR